MKFKTLNLNKKHKVLAIVLFSLIAIQIIVSASSLAIGYSDDEDLDFSISGTMNVNSTEMVGSDENEMGLGNYIVQDSGYYNRWYEQPALTGADYTHKLSYFTATDINEPYYNATDYATFNETDYTGESIQNSSEISTYDVGASKKTHVKVDVDYNYTYSENNVTSISNVKGDVTGDLDSLNDPNDADEYQIDAEYDISYYNVSSVDINKGVLASGTISDLKDGDGGTYMQFDSDSPDTVSSSTIRSGGTDSGTIANVQDGDANTYWQLGTQAKRSGYTQDGVSNTIWGYGTTPVGYDPLHPGGLSNIGYTIDGDNTVKTQENNGQYTKFQYSVATSSDNWYLYMYSCYAMENLPSRSNIDTVSIEVKGSYQFDALDEKKHGYEYPPYGKNVMGYYTQYWISLQDKNDNWDRKQLVYTSEHNEYDYTWTYNIPISLFAEYLDGNELNIRFDLIGGSGYVYNEYNVKTPARWFANPIQSYMKIHHIKATYIPQHYAMDVDLNVNPPIPDVRGYLKFYSPNTYTIKAESTMVYSGTGTYENYFDYATSLSKLTLTTTDNIDAYVRIYYAKFYESETINLDFNSPTNIDYARIYLKVESSDTYTIQAGGDTPAFTGSGTYENYFEYLYYGNTPFSSVSITTSTYDASIKVYYVTIYDKLELMEVDESYLFTFTGQLPIDNAYSVSLRYNVSDTNTFKLYYGNPSEGQVWELIDNLDSTNWTTTSYDFTSVKTPQIRIYTSEETYDHESLTIYLDDLHITANYFPFTEINVYNFTYEVNSIPYTENFTTSFSGIYNKTDHGATIEYIFDSTQFSQYDGNTEFDIPAQNITYGFVIDYTMSINISFRVHTSSIAWRTPTEADLQINGEDVLPTSPKAGYCILESYPLQLAITSDEPALRFKLDIETTFSLYTELAVISRRVLRKTLTLESDHKFTIDKIEFSSNLLISSVWLAGSYYSVSNNSISPNRDIIVGQEYVLDVYLADDLYKEFDDFYANLGSGSFGGYLYGTGNYGTGLFYDDATTDTSFHIQLPTGFTLDNADLEFSDTKYLENYTRDPSENLNDYGYSQSSYTDEDVSWSEDYYETSQNGTKVSESGGSGYEKVYEQIFNALNGEMSQEYNPDGYNSTFSVNDYLEMQNLFPQEYLEELWSSWTLAHDSDYTDSSWDNSNKNLTSALETGSNEVIANFLDFLMNIGSITQNGSLSDIDGNYSTINSGVSGEGAFDYDYENHVPYWEELYGEDFSSNEAYMEHNYNPDNYNSSYSVNPLDMENEFPNEFHEDDWNDWSLTYNNSFTDSSFSGGDLESTLDTVSVNDIPAQSSDFTQTEGTSDWAGDLESIDASYTTFTSAEYDKYYGTYSFEDGYSGWTPSYSPAGDGLGFYVEDAYGHADSLTCEDNSMTNEGFWTTSFSNRASGTIEWWFRVDQTSYVEFWIGDGGSANSAYMSFESQRFYAYDGIWRFDLLPAVDTWHHLKVVFDCTESHYHAYLNGVENEAGVTAHGIDYNGNPTYMDEFVFRTRTNGVNQFWVDAVGYSWTSYNVGDNEDVLYEMNFEADFQQTEDMGGETLELAKLYYSHKTDLSTAIKVSVWDYTHTEWDLIESVTNTATFADDYYSLNLADHVDGTYNSIIRYEEDSNSAQFYLYLDKFKMYYEWTKASGEIYADISKTIDFNFLNRYDSGYDDWQKLYNITLDFRYRFTDDAGYSYLAKYTRSGESENSLTVDGNWHTFTETFQFNSTSLDGFDIMFNITNGLLELDYIDYNIFFECLNTSENRVLGQIFELNYDIDNLGLSDFVKNNGTFYINITYDFDSFSDIYTYYNAYGRTNKLEIIYWIKANDSWYSYLYAINNSEDLTKNFNVSNFMDNNGVTAFQNFNLTFILSGNHTNLIVTSVKLWDYRATKTQELNFTATVRFDSNIPFFSNNTIENITLYYSYKTNISQDFNLTTWNFDSQQYDLINSSSNNQGFYDQYFNLNSSYFNSSKDFKFKFYGANSTDFFKLYLDKFKINISWTKTSGDIYAGLSETFTNDLLNRYDSGFDNYQKLYNFTLEFMYKFANATSYDYFANFSLYGNEYSLTVDGNWHTFTETFQFNSSNVSGFDMMFNITNGELLLDNMNYTLFFECLDYSNRNALYQYFILEPEYSLDYLQKTRGNWILNFTVDFTEASDYLRYNFYNGIDYSLFKYIINVEHEDGWNNSIYNTNSSYSQDITFNITNFLNGLGKTQFKNFSLEVYLTGNPSNLTLDNLTLWDFDSDFYQLNSLYMTDDLLVSFQIPSIYWRIVDRYAGYVEIEQSLNDGSSNLIFNETLQNNTLQNIFLTNYTVGYYDVNLTFYDNYSNWEKWTINFTIISMISITASYRQPSFVATNNTIRVYVRSESPIYRIYYVNSSDYVLQYDNSSYPIYNYSFSFKVYLTESAEYNISVKVDGFYGDSFYLNITGLWFIERTTLLQILNLKASYYQDDLLNITTNLRDMWNNPVDNKLVNYTVEDPDGNFFINESRVTNEQGHVSFGIEFNTTMTTGFYHINCSFTDNITEYMSVWYLMSFELLPITYYISDVSTVNLTVNGIDVVNNTVSTGVIDANSFNLVIEHDDFLTFDLTIENITMHINDTYDYSEYIEYEFILDQREGQISSFKPEYLNLTDIPDNVTLYYFDEVEKDTYTHDTYLDTLYPLNPINQTYQNTEGFTVTLRYVIEGLLREQLTSNPHTNLDSVSFAQSFYTDHDYKFWYFEESIGINEIESFNYLRTGTVFTHTDFVIINGTSTTRKYRLALDQKSEEYDVFNATIDYDPNWIVNYSFEEKTSVYTKIKIDYKSDLRVNDVDIVLSLNRSQCFTNLTLNRDPSNNYIDLVILDIDFTTSLQSLYIEGFRSQSTTNPITNINSVNFNEYFTYNSSILTTYVIDVKPNWYSAYEIQVNNGTYSKVRLSYKADVPISDVNITLNLRSEGCFNDEWELNAIQTLDYNITIPNVDFTNELQYLTLEGTSSMPYTTVSSYESDQNYNRIAVNTIIDFAGFLTYPKYTQAFLIAVDDSWIPYNVYYGNENYSVEVIDRELIQINGNGFDPTIEDSYLHFRTTPFTTVDWEFEDELITITIKSTNEVENAYFLYPFDPDGTHTLELISSDITIEGLTDTGDYSDYLYFTTPKISIGTTIIKIRVNFATPLEIFVQTIIIFAVCGIFIGAYYYFKYNEESLAKIKQFVNEKVVKKLDNIRKEDEGLDEAIIEIKKGKIYVKSGNKKEKEKEKEKEVKKDE